MVLIVAAFLSSSSAWPPGSGELVPGKLQSVLELIIEFFEGQLVEIIGPEGRKFLPMLGTVGPVHLLLEPARPHPGLHVADEQAQRHHRLRPDRVRLLPLPGDEGPGRSSNT